MPDGLFSAELTERDLRTALAAYERSFNAFLVEANRTDSPLKAWLREQRGSARIRLDSDEVDGLSKNLTPLMSALTDYEQQEKTVSEMLIQASPSDNPALEQARQDAITHIQDRLLVALSTGEQVRQTLTDLDSYSDKTRAWLERRPGDKTLQESFSKLSRSVHTALSKNEALLKAQSTRLASFQETGKASNERIRDPSLTGHEIPSEAIETNRREPLSQTVAPTPEETLAPVEDTSAPVQPIKAPLRGIQQNTINERTGITRAEEITAALDETEAAPAQEAAPVPEAQQINDVREALQEVQQAETATPLEPVPDASAPANAIDEAASATPAQPYSPIQPLAPSIAVTPQEPVTTQPTPVEPSAEEREVRELRDALAQAQAIEPSPSQPNPQPVETTPSEAPAASTPKRRRALPVIQPTAEETPTPITPEAPSLEERQEEQLAQEVAAAIENTVATAPAPTTTSDTTAGAPTPIPPPGPIDSANVAAAIQAAVNEGAVIDPAPASPVKNKQRLSDAVRESEQTAIDATRGELRQRYEERKTQQAIANTYQEALRTRSYTLLQTQHPEVYAQYVQAEGELGVQLNAYAALSPSEQQLVQTQALINLRTAFPQVNAEAISAALIGTASTLLTQATAQEAVSTALAQNLASLGVSEAVRSQAIASAAVSGALNATQEAANALAEVEATVRARAARLAPATSPSSVSIPASSPEITERIRTEQRQAPQIRARLQATLASNLLHLTTQQELGRQTALRRVSQPTATLVQGLMFSSAQAPKPLTTGTASAATNTPNVGPTPASGSNTTAVTSLTPTGTVPASDAATKTDADKAAAYYASRLPSARRVPSQPGSMHQTAISANAGASSSPNGSNSAVDQQPLLTLTRPALTPTERFAVRQREMNDRRDLFLGLAGVSAGYEASLGQTVSFGLNGTLDDAIELSEEDILEADQGSRDLAYQQDLAIQRAREQQQALDSTTPDNDPQMLTDQLKNSPLGQQAAQRAKKQVGAQFLAAFSNPITAIVAIIVLMIWLNICLFFPKKDSLWREPLGAGLTIVAVFLDIIVLLLGYAIYALIMSLFTGTIIMDA